ncbi:hypothetical protein ACP4OV_018116 [Aristida adscensionis]
MAAKAVLLLTVSLLPLLSLALEEDICPANPLLPDTPSGYPCKTVGVTALDFSFDLSHPGLTVQPFNAAVATAFSPLLAGVNGLRIAGSRTDIFPGGVVPLHTHPEGSEILLVTDGALSAGFISAANNQVYQTTVRGGEVFVFPAGLLHFQYNVGNTTAVAFSAYSSSNPGLQILDYALFKTPFPTGVLANITSLDVAEIQRLRQDLLLSPLL